MQRGRPPKVRLTPEQFAAAAEKSLRIRSMRGLTQMALATLVGATIGDVSNIERQYRERSSRVAKAILDLPEPL